jgi:hypothetical protein
MTCVRLMASTHQHSHQHLLKRTKNLELSLDKVSFGAKGCFWCTMTFFFVAHDTSTHQHNQHSHQRNVITSTIPTHDNTSHQHNVITSTSSQSSTQINTYQHSRRHQHTNTIITSTHQHHNNTVINTIISTYQRNHQHTNT